MKIQGETPRYYFNTNFFVGNLWLSVWKSRLPSPNLWHAQCHCQRGSLPL